MGELGAVVVASAYGRPRSRRLVRILPGWGTSLVSLSVTIKRVAAKSVALDAFRSPPHREHEWNRDVILVLGVCLVVWVAAIAAVVLVLS